MLPELQFFRIWREQYQADIEEIRKRDTAPIKSLEINLALAINDQPYHIAGNFFYVWDAPSDVYIDVKTNRNDQKAIPCVLQTGLKEPFHTLFITTPAEQAGNLTLLYGTEMPDIAELIDHRSSSSADMDAILAELRGDVAPDTTTYPAGYAEVAVGVAAVNVLPVNATRKGGIIQAKSTNLGLIYLGFDDAVGPAAYFAELQAGMAFTIDDYRGDIWAEASIPAQNVGGGEW